MNDINKQNERPLADPSNNKSQETTKNKVKKRTKIPAKTGYKKRTKQKT